MLVGGKKSGPGQCSHCGKPIPPGPDYEAESRAGAHRACMQGEMHALWVESRCNEIWVTAYRLLCQSVPSPEVSVLPLAAEYRGRFRPADCLEFLDRAISLISQVLPVEGPGPELAEQLRRLRGEIVALVSSATPITF